MCLSRESEMNLKVAVPHWPNQSITHRLKIAGDEAVREVKPELSGFIMSTTCSYFCTRVISWS